MLFGRKPLDTPTAATHFVSAEAHHQQHLAKNPNGYCGLQGAGVVCPIGLKV